MLLSGLTLIRTLPRPWFGAAQKKLFTRYFQVLLLAHGTMLAVDATNRYRMSSSMKLEVSSSGLS